MYCPKCDQKFEEGSRRFCPSDGSRLISEASAGVNAQRGGGVFANLIPKMDAISDLANTASDSKHTLTADPGSDAPPADEEVFFEFDEPKREPPAAFVRPAQTPIDPKPVARKINPYDIPAGHVDLGDSYRTPADSTDFDQDDPEGFVGKAVKGRYRVEELLAEDDSGLTYLAEDKISEDRKVAVRVLLSGTSDEIMESILAEERVSLSHFSHPNVARLIDSGQFTDGTDYLVSEYVDALSIDDILAIHGKIGELRAARVIRQAAGALNEAHQQGILHRDLRPGNLVIEATSSDAEQTKLVNFGASSGEPNEQNLGYKAPEVLDGRVPTISSDIFSLAAVAYEMLTGTLPFAGENVKEILRSQSAGLEVLPTQVRPELAKPVDHILEKALAFNAADRYPKARDFGDAFYAALTELPQKTETTRESLEVMPRDINQPASKAIVPAVSVKPKAEAAKAKPATIPATEPAWKNRSPEPPETGSSRIKWIAAVGLIGLLALLVGGWYYIVNHPVGPEIPVQTGQVPTGQNGLNGSSPISADTEMPPFPRDIPQPPNTNFYQNSKQNLRGDLLLNFVGFTLYYPKDWKVNSPIVSSGANSRGKFLDISRTTPEDRMKEQMLISYYPSKGTFSEDADKFPQLVKEMNDVLKKLPGFRIVSQGDIKLNGEWRAYEVKFQSTGTWPNGEKYELWGRRLFVPAARPGVRNGFEITMLATSIADEVRSLDDVGVKGELASILYTFEPSQNF